MNELSYSERILGDILRQRARAHPERLFVQFKDRRLSYGEVDAAADTIATQLHRLGLGPGDKVSIMLPNCPEFVLLMFGLARLGAVAVPVNTAYKGELLHYVIDNSDSQLLVIDAQWLPLVSGMINRLPKLERIIVVGESAADIGRPALPFQALLSGPSDPPDVVVRHSDLQAIMYTSGTTGPSKGVMVSHCHAVTFAYDWLRAMDYKEEDILYSPLPLFHAIAHTLGVVAVMLVSSQIALAPRFSASGFWNDVRQFDATVAHGIFSIVPILLNQPPQPSDKDHRLRALYFGPSATAEAFEERFGATVVEVYGATETGVVTCAPYGGNRPGSCGLANDRTFEVKVVDDDDNEVASGQVGEIVVRPRHPYAMFQGYYGQADATVVAFRNLWFHTGDFAYKDDDGFFYFVDRKHDSIRRRGENISSYEVERVVNQHPSVLECAATAVPAELYEDEVKIWIVLKPGHQLEPEELIDFLSPRLPYFMVPRYVEILPQLPKTANEKIEKYKLRSMGRSGLTANTWDRTRSATFQ